LWVITWHKVVWNRRFETAWPLKMGSISSPEISVRNQPTLGNIPEADIQGGSNMTGIICV
jgi:hypothetical protein